MSTNQTKQTTPIKPHHTEGSKRKLEHLHRESSHAFAKYQRRVTTTSATNAAASAAKGSKRSGGGAAVGAAGSADISTMSVSALKSQYQFDLSEPHVKEVARLLVSNIPSYEDEIQVSKSESAIVLLYGVLD